MKKELVFMLTSSGGRSTSRPNAGATTATSGAVSARSANARSAIRGSNGRIMTSARNFFGA